MALSFYGTLIAASKKSECLEIEPDFDTFGIQIATEILQLPGSAPTPPLAQTAAFGPFPSRKPCGQGKTTELGLETQLLEKSIQSSTYPGTFASRDAAPLASPPCLFPHLPACLGSGQFSHLERGCAGFCLFLTIK